jgi:ribonuclease HI
MAKRFYVVWKGRQTGVFENWEECKAQVNGYPGAQYKGFNSRPEAKKAFRRAYSDYVHVGPYYRLQPPIRTEPRQTARPIDESYSVDAACSRNPGILEYRCVHTRTRREIFRQGPYQNGTNNIGEFLAIVHALALFKRNKISAPVYSDSRIAIGWVKSKKCRTRLARTETNAKLFELIERAEKWLRNNTHNNQVLKWLTKRWGEIPADYGRKPR